MKCSNCGKELGIDPKDRVEKGEIEELFIYKKYNEEESKHGFEICDTLFYCSIECLKNDLDKED